MSSTEPEVPPQIQTNTATGPCALLNEFFENVPEAIVFVDGEGRVVRANNKFVRMLATGWRKPSARRFRLSSFPLNYAKPSP